MFSVCFLPAVLKYLNQLLKRQKKILWGKYCDRTIEVIMIAFPTVRAETFLFAQLRDEVGIYQSFMTYEMNLLGIQGKPEAFCLLLGKIQ